jgi:hypothetical protein
MKIIITLCLLLTIIAGCDTSYKTTITPDRIEPDTVPIELTTQLGGQQQFVEGDELQFLLSIGQDAYIYMYHLDADGKVVQILPSPNQDGHFYTAGYFLTIPEYEDLYRFKISEPFGEESIWVLASDQSITLEQPLDSIDTIKKTIKRSSIQAYGEYELEITTSSRSRL